MRLSDAIRLGAMLKPQGFGFYQTLGGSCAYGAAMDACGVQGDIQNTISDDMLAALFPISNEPARCPVCTPEERVSYDIVRDVDEAVTHLNDDHRWTREQIAQWVESVERRAESSAAGAVRLSTDPPIVTIREKNVVVGV